MNKRMQSPARCDVRCQAQALNRFYRCLRKNPELPSWEKCCRISSALTKYSHKYFFVGKALVGACEKAESHRMLASAHTTGSELK